MNYDAILVTSFEGIDRKYGPRKFQCFARLQFARNCFRGEAFSAEGNAVRGQHRLPERRSRIGVQVRSGPSARIAEIAASVHRPDPQGHCADPYKFSRTPQRKDPTHKLWKHTTVGDLNASLFGKAAPRAEQAPGGNTRNDEVPDSKPLYALPAATVSGRCFRSLAHKFAQPQLSPLT
jgi:hypothetical protein